VEDERICYRGKSEIVHGEQGDGVVAGVDLGVQ
jgi:hypothetical protein